jgi:hypothetical protein
MKLGFYLLLFQWLLVQQDKELGRSGTIPFLYESHMYVDWDPLQGTFFAWLESIHSASALP